MGLFTSNQLAILQDQVSSLISVNNPHPINFINDAAHIITNIAMDLHNYLPEKLILTDSSILFNIQLLTEQKRKIKRIFTTTRNPFLKYALNAISKQIKKDMKSHRSTDIKKFRVSFFKLPKSWRTLKKNWVTQVRKYLSRFKKQSYYCENRSRQLKEIWRTIKTCVCN